MTAKDRIGVRTAGQAVVTEITVDEVLAVAGANRIATLATEQRIVAAQSGNDVIAEVAVDEVVACAARQVVVARTAINGIGGRRRDGVGVSTSAANEELRTVGEDEVRSAVDQRTKLNRATVEGHIDPLRASARSWEVGNADCSGGGPCGREHQGVPRREGQGLCSRDRLEEIISHASLQSCVTWTPETPGHRSLGNGAVPAVLLPLPQRRRGEG